MARAKKRPARVASGIKQAGQSRRATRNMHRPKANIQAAADQVKYRLFTKSPTFL